MQQEAGLARDQVLRAVNRAGFAITGDQLARWHRAGLVPRPHQRPLGRGHGTVTVYPTGTVEQVVALCRFISEHRSLARAAFRLWWDGFTIDPKRVWGPLHETATTIDAELASGFPSEGRPARGFEGLVKRRLGRERRRQLEEAIREAARQQQAGGLVAFPSIDLPAMPPSLDDLLVLVLPVLVGTMSTVSAVDLVNQSSYEELCAARDEIKLFFTVISHWIEPLVWLWGRKGIVFRFIADLPKAVEPADLPCLLLTSLLVRRVVPPDIRAVTLQPPPQFLHEVAAFKAIHDAVPGAEDIITPMAVRALMRNKEAATRYLPKVQDFFEQHGADVRSVVDADLLPAPEQPSEGGTNISPSAPATT